MLEDLKIFHKTYEFIKWLHSLLNKFPNKEKYTMAQKIENTAMNVLEGIIQSNNEFDKIASLRKTIVELDKLRVFFRMSKDLAFISFQQYEYGVKQIDEIGRMLGGWLKKYESFGARPISNTEKMPITLNQEDKESKNNLIGKTDSLEKNPMNKKSILSDENLLSSFEDRAGLITAEAVNRGGNWNNAGNAGLFNANLNNAPTNTNSNIGFRCCSSQSFRPDFMLSRKHRTVQFWTTLIQIRAEDISKAEYKTKIPADSKMTQLMIENCRNFSLILKNSHVQVMTLGYLEMGGIHKLLTI